MEYDSIRSGNVKWCNKFADGVGLFEEEDGSDMREEFIEDQEVRRHIISFDFYLNCGIIVFLN